MKQNIVSLFILSLLFLPALALAATNHPPVITLKGDASVYLYPGQKFEDPGATARDTEDGNITGRIKVSTYDYRYLSGGTYYVYSIADSAGATSSVRRIVYSVDQYDFGGMYGFSGVIVKGKPTTNGYKNPATGDTSCPTGYTDTRTYGTANVDYEIHFCWRKHQTGGEVYDFGGMYGFGASATVKKLQYNNRLTGDATCPTGYQSSQVSGASNVDWDTYFCYRPHTTKTLPAAYFGGMWGFVEGQLAKNPIDSSGACPAAYRFANALNATTLGNKLVDHPLYYCFYPVATPAKGESVKNLIMANIRSSFLGDVWSGFTALVGLDK